MISESTTFILFKHSEILTIPNQNNIIIDIKELVKAHLVYFEIKKTRQR
jgi:hypothetical protein